MTEQDPAGELLRMIASGADEDRLRALTSADSELRDLAVGVRTRMTRMEERSRSIDQLVESMHDLSGTGGIDDLLVTIVARARRLLLSEVAYFLTFDPDTGLGEMRISEGIMSDAFARLRVEPSTGISGFIAETRKPSWTRDYLRDSRYQHTTTIDTATTEEGLRAIVGVPVMRGARVFGVLLAADRRAHDFRHHDVDLLRSLANHAAILIDNEQANALDAEARRALEETVADLRSHQSETQLLIDFQDQLFGVLLNGGSLQALVDLIRMRIGGSVRVEDLGGTVLAAAGERPTSTVEESTTATTLPLFRDERQLGALVHHGDTSQPDAVRQKVLTRAAVTTSLVLDALHGSESTGLLTAGHLLQDLLRDPTEDRTLRLHSALGVDPEQLTTVAVVESDEVNQQSLATNAHRVVERRGAVAAIVDDTVVVWTRGEDPATVATELHQALTDAVRSDVLVGVADVRVTPTTLRDGIQLARDTVRSLRALGWRDRAATAAETQPLPALLGRLTPHEIDAFVRRELGPVIDHDARTGSALLHTLQVHNAGGGSATETARRLHLHVNTVHQRLNRVEQLLEPLRSTPLQRSLALTIHRLTGATIPSPKDSR